MGISSAEIASYNDDELMNKWAVLMLIRKQEAEEQSKKFRT